MAVESFVRSIEWGGTGPTLLFVHANGFPPGSYRRMLDALRARFRVVALELRPLTVREGSLPHGTWSDFADDYCRFLARHQIKHAIGVGHSLGAVVTLMAANRRPDAFSEITLIEPVVLTPWVLAALAWMPHSLRMHGGMALKALSRSASWPSRNDAFMDLRRRRAFARIDDEGLWDYVNAGTVVDADGVARLRFAREWEAHVYGCVPRIWGEVAAARTPVRVLRASLTSQFDADAAGRWRRRRPDHEVVEIDGAGHLLPLERPLETASLIHRDASPRAHTV